MTEVSLVLVRFLYVFTMECGTGLSPGVTRCSLHRWIRIALLFVAVALPPSAKACPQTNCTLAWPAGSIPPTCPLVWCPVGKSGSNQYYLSAAPYKCRAGDDFGKPFPVGFTNCPGLSPPGRPSDLHINVPYGLFPASFNVDVRWTDPPGAESCSLLGYRVSLLQGDVTYQTFDFPKNYSATSSPGRNRVTLGTNPASFTCPNCLLMQFHAAQALFGHTLYVKVTSLPVKSISTTDADAQAITKSFSVEKCDSDAVDCLSTLTFRDIIEDSICGKPSLVLAGRDSSERICDCDFRRTWNISNVIFGNSSINVTYEWDNLVTAGVRITLYLQMYASKTHQTNDEPLFDLIYATGIKWGNNSRGSRVLDVPVIVEPGQIVVLTGLRDDKLNGRLRRGRYEAEYVVPGAPVQPSSSSTTVSTTTPMSGSVTTPRGESSAIDQAASSTTPAIVSGFSAACVLLLIALVLLFIWRNRFKKPTEPPVDVPKSLVVSEHSPRCYISYSRFTDTSRWNALNLAHLLKSSGAKPILDVEHLNELADNVPAWVEKQITEADCVIVLLDEAYPWNLTNGTALELLNYDASGELQMALVESELLQGDVYSGSDKPIVALFVGAAHRLNSCLPPILRCKTVYQLPEDFNGESEKFGEMVAYIKTTSKSKFNNGNVYVSLTHI